jgi:hypothetical protein
VNARSFGLGSSKHEQVDRHGRSLNIAQTGRTAGVLAIGALLAGCAPSPVTFEAIEAPKLRTLEGAYDRDKWRWIRNADGRPLLTHTNVAKCFVDPEPPLDVHDVGFTLKRDEKTIAGTRYQIVNVFEKNDFWEAVYVRSGSKAPILSVYARGRCQDEAERILATYEQSLVGGQRK